MQVTKYRVTLHNSYLSMLFTDFKTALKSLAVEMPNLTSPLRPLSLSSADITASRVPRSVSCDMLKKFLWRDLKTGQLSFSSFSSVAQFICRTIEDKQLRIILAAFFFTFSSTRFQKRNAWFWSRIEKKYSWDVFEAIENPHSTRKNARASHSNFLTRIKHGCKCFFLTLPKTRSKPLKYQK